MLTVENVWKTFDKEPVLRGATLSVEEGEVVAIIGSSGCGKSTLLRLIAGLDSPDEGTIDMADPNVTLVFQYSALFDSLTVFDNVAFPLVQRSDVGDYQRKPLKNKKELAQKVEETLTFVGLEPEEVASLYPSSLSGGMQKRVSFARAIIAEPKIILYDEPTAGLDPLASKIIEEDIVKVAQVQHTTSIVVTHQRSTILRTAQKIYLMEKGVVSWSGNRHEFLTSDHPMIREFQDEGEAALDKSP